MLMSILTAFCHLFSPLPSGVHFLTTPPLSTLPGTHLSVWAYPPMGQCMCVFTHPSPPRPSTAHINRQSVNVYSVFSHRGSPRLRTPAVLCDVTHVAAGTTKFHNDLSSNLSLSILENNWKIICYWFGFLPVGPFFLRKSRFIYREKGI
jgi:hypothetical protein